ncbi:sigma-70 family RNA polymerase sigma factor [bacterium]|nr:sigma-70 family RNA polymerase sigma factor [bacterium]
MADLSDSEAASRCKSGADPEHAAFRTIYERHGPDVFRFLRRLLKERQAAEDALQETFVRLHRGFGGFDPERALRPYVFSVARNVAIDVLRARSKRERTEPLREGAAPGEAPVVEGASRNESKAAVHESLAALAPEHRSILLLRHVHGLKLEEIADGLSCTVRTARNRLRAACVLLGRELKRRGIISEEVAS